MIWLLLIPYCCLSYGIHGGELATGIDRQVRNLLCAIPFGLVFYTLPCAYAEYMAVLGFFLAYLGSNMGFDNHRLWVKGMVTFPPLGAGLLPLAYWVGDKTCWKNVFSEYFSGLLYGCALFVVKYYG